jgi:hypothetical protein
VIMGRSVGLAHYGEDYLSNKMFWNIFEMGV